MSHMSRIARNLLITAAVGVTSLVLTPATAGAGAGAAATPTFPNVVSVGDTDLPGSIELRNANTDPQTTDVNTVCNFGDALPCPVDDQGITLTPSCGMLGAFSVCDPAGADPGVFTITGTPTGSAGTECDGMQFDFAVIDPVLGQYRFTPQGGDNVTLPGFGALCRIDFTFDVVSVPTIDFPDGVPEPPGLPGVQTVQITDHTQITGEVLTASARGTSEGITVNPAQPTIATTASAATQLGAEQLTDVVTVSGRVSPQDSATVDFQLFGPDDATCEGTPVFESLDVPYPASGGPVTSTAFAPTLPGTYRWIASYSGDLNNRPATGACNDANESVDVSKASPTMATAASPTVALGGGQITDTATVSGRVSPQDSATVDFQLFGPDDATCEGTPVFESLDVPYPAAGEPVSSAAFTPTTPGTYRWTASYSGDANNNPVAGACNDPNEDVVVTKANPTIETVASDDIVLGVGLLSDTATVSGLVNPQAGATIDFRLYGPDDTTCSNTPIFTSLGVAYPAAGGTVSSAPFLPEVSGTYRWVASYSGDAYNNPVAGACNDANENVVVEEPGANAPELPATGASTNVVLILIGAGLILAGGALVTLGNRRDARPV